MTAKVIKSCIGCLTALDKPAIRTCLLLNLLLLVLAIISSYCRLFNFEASQTVLIESSNVPTISVVGKE